MKPIPAEDLWLEGADAPPSLATRATIVAVVLACVFAVFFFIGHATAGGSAADEQPAGTIVGSAQATVVPGGLGAAPALGALQAPRPQPAPEPVSAPTRTPETGVSETPRAGAGAGAAAPAPAPEEQAPSPAPAPTLKAAPAPRAAPAPSSGSGHSGGEGSGGSSFDSSG